jgi:hypothetical protein
MSASLVKIYSYQKKKDTFGCNYTGKTKENKYGNEYKNNKNKYLKNNIFDVNKDFSNISPTQERINNNLGDPRSLRL